MKFKIRINSQHPAHNSIKDFWWVKTKKRKHKRMQIQLFSVILLFSYIYTQFKYLLTMLLPNRIKWIKCQRADKFKPRKISRPMSPDLFFHHAEGEKGQGYE